MKKLTVIFITLLCAACLNQPGKRGQSTTGTKEKKAVKYYQKALAHDRPAATPDSLPYAISLLDSAISLDADYSKAYLLKQAYQIRLGKYKEALKTLDTLQHLQTDDPQLKGLEGFVYLLLGDTGQATAALEKSDSLWNLRLDTISSANDQGLLGTLLGKAANLKLLGKEQKANSIYTQILEDSSFNKEQYKEMKKTIDTLFLKQSTEEFYQYLVHGLHNGNTRP